MADHVCPWWLAYTFDNRLRGLLHPPRKLLGPYVSPGMTVLDVGCGMGFFSLALARLVGERGTVIAADLQDEMLKVTAARAARAGIADRIRTHRCAPDDVGLAARVDFAVAFWMVHEVPDAAAFFRQVAGCLAPGGKMLVAEPRLHVGERRFREIVRAADGAGLRPRGSPPVRVSRSVLLEHEPALR
jgi:2-polyprenyl-3-methyl-5-hydroxy-6-metoxy-1,4-benzoquinol methylase